MISHIIVCSYKHNGLFRFVCFVYHIYNSLYSYIRVLEHNRFKLLVFVYFFMYLWQTNRNCICIYIKPCPFFIPSYEIFIHLFDNIIYIHTPCSKLIKDRENRLVFFYLPAIDGIILVQGNRAFIWIDFYISSGVYILV